MKKSKKYYLPRLLPDKTVDEVAQKMIDKYTGKSDDTAGPCASVDCSDWNCVDCAFYKKERFLQWVKGEIKAEYKDT